MSVTELKRYRMKPNAVVGGLPWWTEAGEYLGRELPRDVRTVQLWEPEGPGSVEVLRCSVVELEDRPLPRTRAMAHPRGLMVAGIALLSLLLPTPAQAAAAPAAPRCRAASFETCAGTGRSVALQAIARGEGNLPAVESRLPRDWSVTGGPEDRGEDWRIPDCSAPRHAHVDCPAPPISVTPEPVTMTLLATGLAGMGAMGLRRRTPRLP